MQMYCVKCRTKRDVENVPQVTLRKGKKATKKVIKDGKI